MQPYQEIPAESTPEIRGHSCGVSVRQDGSPQGRFDGSLGIIGNTVSAPLLSRDDRRASRLQLWALQSVAREIRNTLKLNSCHRTLVLDKAGVDVWKTSTHFRYGGLITCKSVWDCPVCAAKIANVNRRDLSYLIQQNSDAGGSAQLWTFTAPHHLNQSLYFLLNAITFARKKMLNSSAWKRLISPLGLKGTVRGLEVTHSFDNGWHCHFHVLAVLSGVMSRSEMDELKNAIHLLWATYCVRSGLRSPSHANGVTVECGDKAAQYATKWGLEDELTRSHSKKGREGHSTPFDFLRKYSAGDLRYGDLFREYAKEFEGKKQLDWSKGLREAFGMGAKKSDEQLFNTNDDTDTIFARLCLMIWKEVLRQNIRGELLEVCCQGKQALVDYIMRKTGYDLMQTEDLALYQSLERQRAERKIKGGKL